MSDLEENYSYYEYSENELSDDEILRMNKYDEIKHFTLNDYLNFPETNNLLNQEWEDKFNLNIENNLIDIFEKYKELLNNEINNVMFYANNKHLSLFVSLIKYHLKREYKLKLFEDNPWLAEPLLENNNKIV
jgi:hypothetical protein